MSQIARYFIEQAEKRPGQTAICDEHHRKITYRQLYQWAARIQSQLTKSGIGYGSSVFVMMPISTRLYASLIALFSIGAISIFPDPWLSFNQINRIIKKSKPDLILSTSWLKPLTYLLPASWGIPKIPIVRNTTYQAGNLQLTQPEKEDPALVTFTGGTSGQPKGIQRTWNMLHAQWKRLQPIMATEQPVHHFTHYPIVGLMDIGQGNTLILPDFSLMRLDKADLKQFSTHLVNLGTNRITCSPFLLKRFLSETNIFNEAEVLNSVKCGGSRVSYSIASNLLKKQPNIEAIAVYGSSEAEPIATIPFREIAENNQDCLSGISVGKICQNTHARLISITNGPVTNKKWDLMLIKDPGKAGEIIVSGKHVATNYFKDDGSLFQKNKILDYEGNTWHRTGDIGMIKNQEIYLLGRKERIIKWHGRQYFHFPVEEYVEKFFGINDCAYLENHKGHICFCMGSNQSIDNTTLSQTFQKLDYPVDRFVRFKKPLPREPRHRSKLATTRLQQWLKKV